MPLVCTARAAGCGPAPGRLPAGSSTRPSLPGHTRQYKNPTQQQYTQSVHTWLPQMGRDV